MKARYGAQNVNGVRFLVDVVLFLCGLGVLIAALHLWNGCGFLENLLTRHHRGERDPCDYARWLTLVGLIISGYFGFSVASRFIQTGSPNDDNKGRRI